MAAGPRSASGVVPDEFEGPRCSVPSARALCVDGDRAFSGFNKPHSAHPLWELGQGIHWLRGEAIWWCHDELVVAAG